MAQIGIFSDLWIWGVANLRFNYLRCFSINFENCCAHLAANFLYFPNIPNFLYLDGFEETYGQKTKNIGNQKNANLSKSWYLTFFDDEISKLFFHSYGPRIPKWNFAHHLWSKQAQNIRKTPQNTWFTDPCFKSLQTGHPVCQSTIMIECDVNFVILSFCILWSKMSVIFWNQFFEKPKGIYWNLY